MCRKVLVKILFALLIVFLTVANTRAQNGLGDPIINASFGSGTTTHGPELPGLIGVNGEYRYSASGAPTPGNYTTVNNTDFAPAIWWPTQDHTPGDGNNGYMLIVKSRTSGYEVLFRHFITNLCDDTHYEFSAYFLNLSRNGGGIAPDMLLRVETTAGVIIEDRAIGAINYEPGGPQWILKSIDDFTLPAGVSSVYVSVICKTPGGPTLNDLAIDDIAVKAKGQYKNADFQNVANSVYQETCANDQQSFTAIVTAPVTGHVLQWQHKLDEGRWEPMAGETSTTISITSSATPGIHRYRAASAPPANISKFECSVLSNELVIKVKPSVKVNANANPNVRKLYLRGLAAIPLLGASNTTNFSWDVEPGGAAISSLSSSTVLNPLASPDVTTTYVLHGLPDANTCDPPAESRVTVVVADDIKMPNTFTPNADGVNDTWFIGGLNSYPDAVTQVFNRNGQLIYRSVGGGAPAWDGTYKGRNVPAGNYYYIVDLNIASIRLSGSVTVIR